MNDWEIILNQAKKLSGSNAQWKSLGGKVKYKFSEINPDRIIIERLSGGNLAIMGRLGTLNAINRLKKAGTLYKRELINSVVRQTTLVFLHPNISFNSDSKYISWVEIDKSIDNVKQFISEAQDDQLRKIQVLVNERKNQSKFRLNLFKIYNGQCAISKINIDELLEAAHIFPHSKSGINKSSNGILLRSDIHTLFDKDLITINPENNKIAIHESLIGTEYERYNNQKIILPEGCKEFLNLKWKRKFSNKSK